MSTSEIVATKQAPEFGSSVQAPARGDGDSVVGTADRIIAAAHARLLQMNVTGSLQRAPAYWSKSRDEWLVDFVRAEGNDLLAGAVSTVTAKVVANSWYVEGPLLLAALSREMLLHWSAFGGGWNKLISPSVEGFLSRDGGGLIELHRASRSDIEGPAMGFSHLDEGKTYATRNPDYPFKYYREGPGQDPVRIHRSWVAHLVDMPSGKENLTGIGYCSVSRAVTIALTLQQVTKYKRERLSDLPPAGLLLINNLGDEEWDDLTANYDARMGQRGNDVWRNLMVAFGIDPAYPLQAEMIAFSELGQHFNDKEFTEMTVYSFALAFREDPREFWPVSSGPLGTATEAELQARSARLKGEGIICAAIERQLNRSEALPREIEFHFDYQDDEQDMLAAKLKDIKSQTIRRFWEASPNRMVQTGGEGEDGGGWEGGGGGIITTEQAQEWAIRERIVPLDILAQQVDIDRIYDTRAWNELEGFGPPVRYYRDGRCMTLPRGTAARKFLAGGVRGLGRGSGGFSKWLY